jgi:hypothetical protein
MDLLAAFATVLASACLGAMLFFSGGVAPVIFRVLDLDAGGRFVRALFPIYYACCGVLAAAASVLALGRWSGWVLLLAALLFVYLRQSLMPAINRARDAAKGGDTAAGARFDRLHRLSVLLNGSQLVLLIAAILGLTLA